MTELSSGKEREYRVLAEKHADFLCDKVFRPAFIMAFIHGAKHGREDTKTKKETDND